MEYERLSTLTNAMVKQAPGSDFAKFAWLLMHSKNDTFKMESVAARFVQAAPAVFRVTKAAVSALGTTSAGFADDATWQSMSREFIALVNERTVYGQLQNKMRRVAFLQRTLVQLTPTDASWVGESKPKPMSSLTFDSTTIPPAKVVALVVFTEELSQTWSRATEQNIRDSLVASVAKFIDGAFLNPLSAAVAGTNPASVTYGVTATPSTGSAAAQISADLRAMLNRMVATGSDLSSVAIILHPQTALFMSSLLTTGGDLMFPNLGAVGGEIWKIPVMTSLAAGEWSSPSERVIVAIDDRGILYADDGKVLINASREASLQFVSDPVSGSVALVSLWQTNHTGLRVERFVSWQRADDNAVQVISGVQF